MRSGCRRNLTAPTSPDPVDLQHRFAAYVAHELRTPIALQLALAEAVLADPRADDAAFRAMAGDIVASCEEQRRLIEALLDLTRGERGLTRHEPVDIAAITRRALSEHEVDGLRCVSALEPAVASGDRTLLERLAANLVSNAIRHNIPSGRIDITTRTEARRAVLSVANSGPFIPPGELTRLFQPFERFGSHPRVGNVGVGLGLAIVQSIADAHAATVAACARASGGLEIEISFPGIQSTREAAGTERHRISQVTDHPAVRQRQRDLALLRRVRDRIDREYAEPLDVEALARDAHMSAGHLSRQFKLAYGESPYSYLMTRRIERAMALLRRGDLSVTEVCFEVGCSSLGTFSTRFTELVGMPPSAYQRQEAAATSGMPPCVAKQVTKPIRNREAPVTRRG